MLKQFGVHSAELAVQTSLQACSVIKKPQSIQGCHIVNHIEVPIPMEVRKVR